MRSASRYDVHTCFRPSSCTSRGAFSAADFCASACLNQEYICVCVRECVCVYVWVRVCGSVSAGVSAHVCACVYVCPYFAMRKTPAPPLYPSEEVRTKEKNPCLLACCLLSRIQKSRDGMRQHEIDPYSRARKRDKQCTNPISVEQRVAVSRCSVVQCGAVSHERKRKRPVQQNHRDPNAIFDTIA